MWSRGRIFFLLLIFLSSFLHLICLDYSSRYQRARFTLDSWEYLWAAHNLQDRTVVYAGDLSEPRIPALYSRRPPLYPCLIALTQFFWDDLRAVILVQVSLSLISGYLLWCLLGLVDVFGRTRPAAVAAFLFYPAQMIYTQTIMPGIFLQTFLLLCVYCLALFLKTGNARYLWIMNASLSLALLTKPILVFFWLPNLAFHAWVGLSSSPPSCRCSCSPSGAIEITGTPGPFISVQ